MSCRDERVSASSFPVRLLPIHRPWRDGRLGWSERKIRTKNQESGAHGRWRLLYLRYHAPYHVIRAVIKLSKRQTAQTQYTTGDCKGQREAQPKSVRKATDLDMISLERHLLQVKHPLKWIITIVLSSRNFVERLNERINSISTISERMNERIQPFINFCE